MHVKQLKPTIVDVFNNCTAVLTFYWHPLFGFRSSIMIGTALNRSDMRKVTPSVIRTQQTNTLWFVYNIVIMFLLFDLLRF